MKSKSAPRLIILAAAWLGGVTSALAQSPQAGYPTKVVKILAPYSSGAGPSIFMRIMGDKLAKAWGQQVIVDSRPGASGFIAIEAGKNAAPDGHEGPIAADPRDGAKLYLPHVDGVDLKVGTSTNGGTTGGMDNFRFGTAQPAEASELCSLLLIGSGLIALRMLRRFRPRQEAVPA